MTVDNNAKSSSADDATVFRNDSTILRAATDRGADHSLSGGSLGKGDRATDAPKVLKQRFVLEENVGSGGMGTVYRAKDLRKVEARDSQPYVAVKVLNNDFRKHPEAFIALEREASKSQTLRHSNIVSIFDFDKDADVPFITMELLEGEELADTLRQYPNGLPSEMAWKIILGMVSGLEHAHAEGVVHADFKPGNIFITEETQAKVLDFGIARAVRSNQVSDDTDFDPARLAALTPAYASREMLNGDNPEPRDDLYSLGVVMYMVLSGRHPYGRLPATEAAQEGLIPERPKGVNWQQWRVIQRCLDFNRQGRPADAGAVREALFARPLWQRFGLVASVAMFAVAVLFALTYEPPDITEVREEVRQATLIQAQADRIEALLEHPVFDGEWSSLVLTELDTLRKLDAQHPANDQLTQRAEGIFRTFVRAGAHLDDAVRLHAITRDHGQMPLVEEELILRLRKEVADLHEQSIDTQWLSDATRRLALIDELFPDDQTLNSVRVELAERVRTELPTLLTAHTEVASEAWTLVEESIADDEARLQADEAVSKAVQATASQVAKEKFAESRAHALARFAGLLNVSCLRLDLGQLDSQLAATLDAHRSEAQAKVAEKLSQCHARLVVLDPSAAEQLASKANQMLGDANWQTDSSDPCAAHYLLGNGRAQDRAGFCVDRFKSAAGSEMRGPKLVVVPGKDGMEKFAISKYEVSWRQFAAFCEATQHCQVERADEFPATDLSVEVMEAYAAWLSSNTGYRYRLPTLTEWTTVAVGEPDPNRNCLIDIDGVRRGSAPLAVDQGLVNDLGVVHLFGNASEVVRADTGYAEVGGGFNDPISRCSSESLHAVSTDAQTGFRLVRELS